VAVELCSAKAGDAIECVGSESWEVEDVRYENRSTWRLLMFTDRQVEPGNYIYLFHLREDDGDELWSSPVWIHVEGGP
jgi:hypothetical protein